MTPPRSAHPNIGFISTWPIYQGTTIDRHAHALVQGICAAARDRECRLLIGAGVSAVAERARWRTVWPVPAPEVDFVPVGPWNSDGLIIVSDDLSPAQATYARDMQSAGMPVVFTTPEGPGPRVVVDNRAGIRAAVTHLFEHGHRRIAFIAGTRHRGGDSAERLRTYYEVLEEAGLEADRRLVAFGEHRFDGGLAAMHQVLEHGARFTAVVASNDLSCLGAIEALRQAGRRVPQDVAAIGFDDILDARSSTPSLTTVRHPTYALGYQAVLALLARLENPRADPLEVVVPTRLIRRQSCGCRRGQAEPWVPSAPAQDQLEGLSRQMAEAAFMEARHSSIEQLEGQCRAIVTALLASAKREDERPLHEELARLLAETDARGEDPHAWQAAISTLYLRSDELMLRAPAVDQGWFMGLLDHARVEISEEGQRHTTRALLRHVDMMSELGLLTARLIAAQDVAETCDILVRHLPRLGIEHFLVAVFDGDEEDPVAESRVVMAGGIPAGAGQLRFPSRQFPPASAYPAAGPLQMLVLPLRVDDESYGFVALPTTALEPGAAIVSNLATAIRASRLYQDAVHGRQLAEDAARLKSRFLSMVSHELRTPLSVVVGLSDMVLRESRDTGQLTPAAIRDLGRLATSAQHLGRLIGDVLDLASSEAGQLRLVRQSVDLAELVRELSPVGEQMAREKDLGWRLEVPAAGPIVMGDRTRLRQVVLNLLANAVKYTDAGEVVLALVESRGEAILSVSDTGPGIAAHEQTRVFDEFYRAGRNGGGSPAGSLGLGLAIAKQLVLHHGGRISVQSPASDGRGSIFRVTIPTVGTLVAMPALVRDGSEILILTRSHDVDDRLADGLRESGIAVRVEVVDGTNDLALRVLQVHPAAVVLEGDLAAGHGWQLVRALKGQPGYEAIPVLAWRMDPGFERGSMLELDYLIKPLQVAELARTLMSYRMVADTPHEPVILVVDDDPDLREVHARVVEQVGGRAIQAADGAEALALMERQRPDLVVLDLAMPGMDGFELLERMRSHDSTRDVPVVVVTGQVLSEEDIERLNHGVATILNKGLFTPSETASRIQRVLGHQRALGGPTQQLVRRATAFIQAHHAEPITREDIARHVAMSPDYLTDCFHKELGVTPIVYLNRCRIQEAKSLLDRTDLAVTEIALAVGFSEVSHFTRMFHREVGVSPRAYRRGQRSVADDGAADATEGRHVPPPEPDPQTAR